MSVPALEKENFSHHNEILNQITNIDSLNHISDKKSSILRMKNEWTTHSSIEVQRKILKCNTKIIQDYMNSLAVPSWYRGVSQFQKKSADRLLNAIRDDCAQRTTYRTMRCLESIGLDPLPTKRQLHTILQYCGGSDLALLWFLMEWLYREIESDSYSVNEQLIMTSIAHLDMNTTLKELDRILPPAQNKITKMSKKKRRIGGKLSSKNIRKFSEWKELPYFERKYSEWKDLPYFERLPQPLHKKINYIDFKLKQKPFLNNYRNPLVNSSNIRDNFNYHWFQNSASSLNDFIANTIDENKHQTIHRQQEDIEYLRISFDAQLNDIAKTKVQEMRLRFGKNEESHKRVMRRFANDVEKNRSEFNKLLENCQQHSTTNLLSNKFPSQSDIGQMSNSSIFDENDSETKYFIATQNQQPFIFDYSKIFAYEDKNFELDGHYGILNKMKRQSPFDSYNYDDCENIWQQEVIKHEKMQLFTTVKDATVCNVVNYGLEYYDPDNDELMDKMLKDALDIMKQNQKFIFASLPAAHRFPMLREWIRLRYGKIYKKEYLTKSFKESLPIFKALTKVGLPVEFPSNADMGKDLIIDYSCRDYVLQKSNHIRKEYYSRIDKALLAQSRVIYLAMRPFLDYNDSSSNTIFAYMPAHKRENYHFRPWKLEECMKYKQVNYLHHQGQSRSKRVKFSDKRLRKIQKSKKK